MMRDDRKRQKSRRNIGDGLVEAMVVIVVTGSIGAGKTTALRLVQSRIEERALDAEVILEDTDDWQFYLERFYGDPAGYGFLLQTDILSHFQRVTKRLHVLERTERTVFVERSPMDILHVFLEANKAHYRPETFDALGQMCREYERMDVWINAKFVFLEAPVVDCLDRIRQRDRKGEDKIDGRYLETIHQNYQRMVGALGGVRVLKVDNGAAVAVDDVAEKLLKI